VSGDLEQAEKNCREMLALLHREYEARCKPIIEALVQINAMRSPTYLLKPDGSVEIVETFRKKGE